MSKVIIPNSSRLGGDGSFHTEVRWNPDDYVQLATVKETENFATLEEVEGFFIDLDRKGVNDLIEALRLARDEAFGKDA